MLQIYFDNKEDTDEAAKALLKATTNKPAPYLLQVWGNYLTLGTLSEEQDPNDSSYKYKKYLKRTIVENNGEKTWYNNEWR